MKKVLGLLLLICFTSVTTAFAFANILRTELKSPVLETRYGLRVDGLRTVDLPAMTNGYYLIPIERPESYDTFEANTHKYSFSTFLTSDIPGTVYADVDFFLDGVAYDAPAEVVVSVERAARPYKWQDGFEVKTDYTELSTLTHRAGFGYPLFVHMGLQIELVFYIYLLDEVDMGELTFNIVVSICENTV